MKKFMLVFLSLVCVVSLFACTPKNNAITYDVGNKDRAERYAGDYDDLVKQFGKAEMKDSASDYDSVLTGVGIVRLYDFSGDGIDEIYYAYSDGTKPYVNRHKIVGFDNGAAVLLDEEITSAENGTPCVWIYTDDSGKAYIVKGDDLSKKAEYYSHAAASAELSKSFELTDGKAPEGGNTDKFKLVNLTKDEFDAINEENKKVIDSINNRAK